jgi:hypothetical protein
MSTAVIISITICATIIILFVVACVYDYKVKTADIRAIKRFEKAFGVPANVKVETITPEHTKTPPADSGENLDFPNTSNDLRNKYQ